MLFCFNSPHSRWLRLRLGSFEPPFREKAFRLRSTLTRYQEAGRVVKKWADPTRRGSCILGGFHANVGFESRAADPRK